MSGISPQSKKRKLPQTSINDFFGQNSSKRLKQGPEQPSDKNNSQHEQKSQIILSKKSENGKSPKEESKQYDLAELLKLNLDKLDNVAEFDQRFQDIANCILNEYVLTINHKHKYRIAEIEFYFNDSNKHPDTFCHGDILQKECAKWYFHRQNGKNYKTGTYKGLDISFGQGDKAFGGILIRAIQSLTRTPQFIEGPCNTVNKILEHNSDEKKLTEVMDLVSLQGFSLDVFTKESRLFLAPLKDEIDSEIQKLMETKKVWRCPRVGLTLKRYDQHKEKFWMSDYRFLTFPDKNKKMQCFTILSMIRSGMTPNQIIIETKVKQSSVDDLLTNYKKGKEDSTKKYMKDFAHLGDKMTNAIWAQAYGLHSKINL